MHSSLATLVAAGLGLAGTAPTLAAPGERRRPSHRPQPPVNRLIEPVLLAAVPLSLALVALVGTGWHRRWW